MRERATKALISCGIPMNQPGFIYIVDILELFEQNGAPITNMKAVYSIVSKRRNTTINDINSQIEYTIKYAFSNGRISPRMNYFGLGITPKSNGNYIAMMWQRLKEEE